MSDNCCDNCCDQCNEPLGRIVFTLRDYEEVQGGISRRLLFCCEFCAETALDDLGDLDYDDDTTPPPGNAMSARERREKHPRPPRNEASAAKMRADHQGFYDEANETIADLTDLDLIEMMGQLTTYLNQRIQRIRGQLLIAHQFHTGDRNIERTQANLDRIERNLRQAVALLRLINTFESDQRLPGVIRTWASHLDPCRQPEERA